MTFDVLKEILDSKMSVDWNEQIQQLTITNPPGTINLDDPQFEDVDNVHQLKIVGIQHKLTIDCAKQNVHQIVFKDVSVGVIDIKNASAIDTIFVAGAHNTPTININVNTISTLYIEDAFKISNTLQSIGPKITTLILRDIIVPIDIEDILKCKHVETIAVRGGVSKLKLTPNICKLLRLPKLRRITIIADQHMEEIINNALKDKSMSSMFRCKKEIKKLTSK